MSGMNRREYKRKDSDDALDEASEIETNSEQWKSTIPAQFERIASSRAELRVAGIKSINFILTSKWIGEDLNPLLNDLALAVRHSIFNYSSIEEHNQALLLLCNLALNSFSEFESCVDVFLNDVMPELPNTTDSQYLRFFSTAFVVSFSVLSQDTCLRTLKRFADFLTNKHNRTTDFSPRTVASIISGITLMISLFPSAAAASNLYDELSASLNAVFESKKSEILLAALDFLSAMYSSLVDYEETEQTDEEDHGMTRIFANSYIAKVKNLPSNLPTKAEASEVKSRCREVIALLNNEPQDEQIVLNSQIVQIDGFRHSYVIQSIKRVTQQHFQQVMTNNNGIHTTLGFDIMSQRHAMVMKKKMRKEIKMGRLNVEKDRKVGISKKRMAKEGSAPEEE